MRFCILVTIAGLCAGASAGCSPAKPTSNTAASSPQMPNSQAPQPTVTPAAESNARTTASPQDAQSPEVVIKEFYTWYIHVSSRQIDPLKKQRDTLKKYVTLRFIREMDRNEKLPEREGFDADYFFQAQDELPSEPKDEAKWVKSMSISNVVVKDTTATAIATFMNDYPRVALTLIKEDGAWKIDKVTNKARG